MLRVGVIGSGAFAEQCHLPELQSHPQAQVVAISGRRPEHLRSLAARFKVPSVYTDYRELCARPDIDAITVVSSNSEHCAQATAVLLSGKHVLCEKPMATDISQAREMVRAADRSGKVHQMAFTYRYLFGLQELRRRVRRGDIGVPYHVRAQHNSWNDWPSSFARGAQGSHAQDRVGVLYNMGPHLFDLARYLFGPIESTMGFHQCIPRSTVESQGDAVRTKQAAIDDLATAWFTHKNGVRGQWFASRGMPWFGEKAHVEVIGDGGTLRASLSRGGVDVLRVAHPSRKRWNELPLPKEASNALPSALSLMIHSFVDACLRGSLNADVDASFHDGFAAQLAIVSIERASKTLPWVQLEPAAMGATVATPTYPRRRPASRDFIEPLDLF